MAALFANTTLSVVSTIYITQTYYSVNLYLVKMFNIIYPILCMMCSAALHYITFSHNNFHDLFLIMTSIMIVPALLVMIVSTIMQSQRLLTADRVPEDAPLWANYPRDKAMTITIWYSPFRYSPFRYFRE